MKSIVLGLSLFVAPGAVAAQTPPAAASAASPDYGKPENWLCRPGTVDPCDANQDATIIKADGSRSTEKFSPTSNPKFDCFYVYPTVSLDRTPNSDMIAGPEENTVAAAQAGRFAAHCRVFAPLYRQVTLTALQALLLGKPVLADRAMAYRDVRAAWDEYLAYDNHGRGVVLIGHSQGSGILKQLVADAIEGTPTQKLIISVLIPGTNVAVPAGKDVGGDLKATPLCHTAKDVGSRGAGMASAPMGPWTTDAAAVTTPFVKVPGLISTACTSTGKFTYLAVSVNAKPTDKRTQTIVGDVVVGTRTLKDWGLHLVDMPVVMGNLVELSDAQAKVWAGKQAISAAQ